MAIKHFKCKGKLDDRSDCPEEVEVDTAETVPGTFVKVESEEPTMFTLTCARGHTYDYHVSAAKDTPNG